MPIYKPKKPARKPSYYSIELTIRGLSDDGRGIASDNGRTVFVDGALPDEVVNATVMSTRRNYSEAKVKDIVEPSSKRLLPPCSVFKQCGGCSVQYMDSEQQLQFKQDAVLSQLSRWANLVPEQVVEPISLSHYGYRQRVRLAVDYHKNGDVYLGFKEATSKRTVNVKTCLVAEPRLQVLLPLLKQWLDTLKANIVSHVELVNTASAIGIVVRHTRPLNAVARESLQKLLPESTEGHIWFQSAKGVELVDVGGNEADPRMEYCLEGSSLTLQFHPQDFIQSNHAVNNAMVKQAVDWMAPQSDEHIVDLFCGIGNFSLPLAQKAKSVTGIEGVEAMVSRALENASLNKLANTHFEQVDLFLNSDEGLSFFSPKRGIVRAPIDGLLLDPPRSGAKAICQNVIKLEPKRVVYVSCDSSTFARDAKLLSESGYRLSRLGVIDMFPQTSHVEVMGLFTL